MVPAAQGGRRAGGRERDDRRARAQRLPGLDAVGVFAVLAQFAAGWAIGVACATAGRRPRRRVREADERAEAERQSAARVLAEERLRIAQELHDVVAHSMSVIAVQAGVGAHVLDDRPEQARAALEAISATSRDAHRDAPAARCAARQRRRPIAAPGSRSRRPAPARRRRAGRRRAGDAARRGTADGVHAGIELSAYRVVQEALTNVIKHAGTPTRVDVTVRHLPGSLAVEVVDDGRGLAARSGNGGAADAPADGSGTASSACASGSSCGAASSRSGRRPAAATASRRCCRTVTPNDDPVVVADDQALVRSGFTMLLSGEPDIEVVGEASNGAEAVALAASEHPDVMLMDVRMPVMDGLEATRRITGDESLASTRS